MVQKIKTSTGWLIGSSSPVKINPSKLGLESKNIKLIPYVTDFDRAENKTFKEMHYKAWLKKLHTNGAYVILWKGKGRLTLQTREYAQQTPQGALFMSNTDLMRLFKEVFVSRHLRLQGVVFLEKILRGQRRDQSDGLLAKLNNKKWDVKITDSKYKVLYSAYDLKEDEASKLLTLKMNTLKFKGTL